eukprot:8961381-Ditylum_brightwellii.AAC.1
MNQQRANVRSAQPKQNTITINLHAIDPDYDLTESIKHRTNEISPGIIDLEPGTGKIFTDQTGRFPILSSRGFQYIYVLYDYDSNAILAEPIRNHTEGELIRAFSALHTYLLTSGLKPRLQVLDNEASAALQKEITNKKMNFQLAPPHVHRQNAAE